MQPPEPSQVEHRHRPGAVASDGSGRGAVAAALRPAAWIVSLGAWALVAVLVTATILHTDSRRSDFGALLEGALPAWGAYVLLTPPVAALDAWLTCRPRPSWIHVLVLSGGGVGFIAVIHAVSMAFGSGAAMPWSWVVYALVIVLSRGSQRRQMLRAQELQSESLRRQLAEARVVALQSRLQPHFLFNTLNAVSASVETEPEQARRMLVRLSDLLRSVLQLNAPEISLAEDLQLLAPYVDLQSIRFGERLSVRIDVPDELVSCSVPALLLQPLVENAIQHGVGARAEGGVVVVSARTELGMLIVSVTDDGVGADLGSSSVTVQPVPSLSPRWAAA